MTANRSRMSLFVDSDLLDTSALSRVVTDCCVAEGRHEVIHPTVTACWGDMKWPWNGSHQFSRQTVRY